MLKRINLAAILVFVSVLQTSAFQSAEWIKVSRAGSGFSVIETAVAVLSGKTDSDNVDRFFASFAFAPSQSHAKP
ncbi:MAG: hypothetical protein ABR607_07070 [Pyrinomonadaceae bacterium]